MHALVGIWTMDETRREEQDHILNKKIVPLVRSQPGFVSGYWMHDPETGKSHAAIVFDSHSSAVRFRALVESRTQLAARALVTSDILATVEVVADAHHEGGLP